MKSLVFMMTLCLSFVVNGQYRYVLPNPFEPGNPGNLNQEEEVHWQTGVNPNWSILLAGSTSDEWSQVQSLTFPFDFNGSPVTYFKVSNTGILTFDTAVISVPSAVGFGALPDSVIPDNSICIWGIKALAPDDAVITKTFGSAPNRQMWIQFNSCSDPLTTGLNYTYWSIVLEETTNNIYLVDQYSNVGTQVSCGIQISNSQAFVVPGSPNLPSQGGTFDPSDNVSHKFVTGVQPGLDLGGLRISMQDWVGINEGPFPVSAVYANYGADTITSLILNLAVDDSIQQVDTLTNLSLLPSSVDTLRMGKLWQPSITGINKLSIWTSHLNGSNDENPSDDTLKSVVSVATSLVPKKPVFELFTSSTCVPCYHYNNGFDPVLTANFNQITYIKYPYLWNLPGDPYHTEEIFRRGQGFYSVPHNPHGIMNGTGIFSGNPNYPRQSDFDLRYAEKTFLDIEAYRQISGQNITMNLTVVPYADMVRGGYKMFIVIYEVQTTNNAKGNGQTEFFHVTKKMYPDERGIRIDSLRIGRKEHFSFNYTFNGNYRLPSSGSTDPIDHSIEHSVEDFNALDIAVWIQDTITKEVIQSSHSAQGVKIKEYQAILNSVYPIPAGSYIMLETFSGKNYAVELVNASGQVVLQRNISGTGMFAEIHLNDKIQSGVYFLSIIHEDGRETRPIVVKK